MSEPRALLCLHPEFPDRAYHVVIHEYLSSEDLSRVDCSFTKLQRQRFQRLMRGMDWAKFIRENANWSLDLVDWMRDRGVILPEKIEDKLEGRGFKDSSGYCLRSLKCPSFSLLEQFMVSGMHEAVFTMVKAGWPREIEQPLYFAPDSPFYRIPILLWACRHCYLDTIKFLVNERNASVDVFEEDQIHQYHCLHEVCRGQDSSSIENGENEIPDSKRVEILRFLIEEAGADITTLIDGSSLLDWAGLLGRFGVVKYILEEKNILKLEESRVAQYAAHKFHYDLLVYLIEKRHVPVRSVMEEFYYGVRESKEKELFHGLSSVRIQQQTTRRSIVKAYLKGLLGAEYNSDKEEDNFPDTEESDSSFGEEE